MIQPEEALSRVLEACPRRPPVSVQVREAAGRFLVEDAVAQVPVPPFANSAMDGYALRSGDVGRAPAALRVVDTVLAGRVPSVEVGPGEAVRIMTGAMIPGGADAVCMVEKTCPERDGSSVVIEAEVFPGENVRSAGDDVAIGDVVLPSGTRLGPAQIGALISAGCAVVKVTPRLAVGVLSTGDELDDLLPARGATSAAPASALASSPPPAPASAPASSPPPAPASAPASSSSPAPASALASSPPPAPGHIYDSNRPMLLAMLAEAGCEPVDLGRVGDDESSISDAIVASLEKVDAVVLSGGVSVGDVDLVRVVLEKLGSGSGQWMQLAVRPAKPFSFAVVPGSVGNGSVPAFGLPGNPVSAAVSFELLVRPALMAMTGLPNIHRPVVKAVAGEALRRKPDGKLHLVRVRLVSDRPDWITPGRTSSGYTSSGYTSSGYTNSGYTCSGYTSSGYTSSGLSSDGSGEWTALPCAGQGSHQIRSLALADGLALVADGDGIAEGEVVSVMVIDQNVFTRELS